MATEKSVVTALGPNDPDDGDEGRRLRGMAIAASVSIKRNEHSYSVPSQSGNGRYAVSLDRGSCSCPDFDLRNHPCKHIYAVQFAIRSRGNGRSRKHPAPLPRPRRVTYGQNWAAYDAAQVHEQEMFGRLLRDLCDTIEQPEQRMGRPRLLLSDMAFSIAMKVYTTFSARRAMTSLRNAYDAEQLTTVSSFTSIGRYLRDPELTLLLRWLIQQSAIPLSAVEQDFSPDSSGFSTSPYADWFGEKWGNPCDAEMGDEPRDPANWVKAHIMSGNATNIIVDAVVTPTAAHDSKFFIPFMETTARSFAVRHVTADKAYLGRDFMHAVDDVGGTLYVPFKARSLRYNHRRRHDRLWEKAYDFYHMHRDEFLAVYNQRSNVEATFSMLKRIFGHAVRSRTQVAQVNEVLTKMLCHNIRVLVKSMFEMNIVPLFTPPVLDEAYIAN